MSSRVDTAVEWAVWPLDRLRARWLRLLGPVARVLVVDRELRIALIATSTMLVALAMTVVAPLWLLALGPILLGVPHVLSDFRYCVARRGYHLRPELVLWCGAPLLAMGFGASLWVGLLAVPAACVVVRGAPLRRLFGGALALAAVAWAYSSPRTSLLVLAHAHNVIAVLLWWHWRPRDGRSARWHWLPLALYAAISIGLVSGAGDALVLAAGGLERSLGGLSLARLSRSLAPAGVEPILAQRLVLLYAFAQAMHYWAWLRLIPEEDRRRETPRTFRKSWRALRHDLGIPLLVSAGLALSALAVWAVFDLATARIEYLRFVRFHAVLELAALSVLFLEGWREP